MSLPYNQSEQDEIIYIFNLMLKQATKDGGKKREAGLKPSWKDDTSHEAALFSHLSKWKHGERADSDSKAHPLVHLAWRALAIAYQEGNMSYANVNREKKSNHSCPLPDNSGRFGLPHAARWECSQCGRIWVTNLYGWAEVKGPR